VVSESQDDESDINENMFHANYRKAKQNPLYSSDPDLTRSSSKPVEAPPSQTDSEDEIAPARKPLVERPPSHDEVRESIHYAIHNFYF